uniref:Uncharacterized protein n=1 Tax=Populus davidiana TaxID=266767 RepID=A0A6M2E6F5_9ROSI
MAVNLVNHIGFRAHGAIFCSIAVTNVSNAWFNLPIIHFTEVDIIRVGGLMCQFLYIRNRISFACHMPLQCCLFPISLPDPMCMVTELGNQTLSRQVGFRPISVNY